MVKLSMDINDKVVVNGFEIERVTRVRYSVNGQLMSKKDMEAVINGTKDLVVESVEVPAVKKPRKVTKEVNGFKVSKVGEKLFVEGVECTEEDFDHIVLQDKTEPTAEYVEKVAKYREECKDEVGLDIGFTAHFIPGLIDKVTAVLGAKSTREQAERINELNKGKKPSEIFSGDYEAIFG